MGGRGQPAVRTHVQRPSYTDPLLISHKGGLQKIPPLLFELLLKQNKGPFCEFRSEFDNSTHLFISSPVVCFSVLEWFILHAC